MSHRLMVVIAWVFCFSACGDDTKPPAADSKVAVPDQARSWPTEMLI